MVYGFILVDLIKFYIVYYYFIEINWKVIFDVLMLMSYSFNVNEL